MKCRYGLVVLAVIIGGMTSCAPAATESTASCIDRMATWDNNGGLRRFDAAIGSNAPKVVKADALLIAALKSGTGLTAAESALQSVAAAIRSDTAVAEADPPPVCVPHLRADEEKSLSEYSKTAPDYENAVTEIRDKNYDTAAKDLAAANAAANAANADLKAADKDDSTFIKG
jgi:hypothetical protein